MLQNLQRALGFSALVWAAFLLPRTGLVLWIGANALYGLLAFAAAATTVRGFRHLGLSFATAGLFLFTAANGAVAHMACSSGGACTTILAVIVAIGPAQLAIIIADARTRNVLIDDKA